MKRGEWEIKVREEPQHPHSPIVDILILFFRIQLFPQDTINDLSSLNLKLEVGEWGLIGVVDVIVA